MKQKMMLCLSLLIGLSAYAQNKFQKGYLIKNDGTKIECYIQNNDWVSNPTNFKYKQSETSAVVTANLAGIKEFSVGKAIKYKRFSVDIDRSSKRLNELSTKRTPVFKKETLFLKVLVEGSTAVLYSYTDGDLRRYFYKTPTQKITQLIYKSYKTENGRIGKNELYKKQLSANFPCSSIEKSPSYTKNSLAKYFIAYNNCKGTDSSLTDFTISETKGKMRVKIKGGLNYFKVSATELGIPFGDPNYDSEYKTNPRFGIELEYLLPSNNNRWGVFIEPSYQSFKGDAELVIEGAVNIIRSVSVDYKSIELPFGIRHYFPLSNESNKLFINAAMVLDFPMDSTIRNKEVDTGSSLFFGAGYEFQKFSIEARYSTGRSLNKFPGLETSYSGITINLGYVIF